MSCEHHLSQRLGRRLRQRRIFPKVHRNARRRRRSLRDTQDCSRVDFKPLADFPERIQIWKVSPFDPRQCRRAHADFLGDGANAAVATFSYKPSAERFEGEFFHTVLQTRR